MFSQLKQLKELRERAQQIKETLNHEIVTGEAAGGKATITMNGNYEALSVTIDPSLLSSENKVQTEQLIMEATNDALRKVRQVMASKLSGVSLPGM